MSSQPKLYQPFEIGRPGIVGLHELAGFIMYHVPASQPQDEDCPETKWYCTNRSCVVREVAIFCKLYGDDLPRMRCPACRKPMQFRHYLRVETLAPYNGPDETELELEQGPIIF